LNTSPFLNPGGLSAPHYILCGRFRVFHIRATPKTGFLLFGKKINPLPFPAGNFHDGTGIIFFPLLFSTLENARSGLEGFGNSQAEAPIQIMTLAA